MSNGWMTKLLNAQVRRMSPAKKRARLHALSGLSSAAGLRLEAEERIRAAVWRVLAPRQAGVAFGRPAIMCPPWPDRSPEQQGR
jgi:hypothetical protein